MCVRLSPSHPAARIVVGLYILLATFLIGFFVVRVTSQIHDLAFTSHEQTQPNLVFVEGPTFVSPCNNRDGVSIIRWHNVPHSAAVPDRIIGIANEGSEPIYFSDGALQIDDSIHFGAAVLVFPRPSDSVETELKSFYFGDFRLPEFTDDRSFTATLTYRVGDSGAQHVLNAHFSRYGQVHDGCTFPTFKSHTEQDSLYK